MWLFIVLPLLCTITVAGYLFRRSWAKNREELLGITGIFLLISGLISGLCYMCGTSAGYYEVWNYRGLSVKHQEQWSTKESRQVKVSDGRDSKGNERYHYVTEYYTDYHGPYFTAIDEYNHEFDINEEEYYRWIKTWNNEKKTGEHRGSADGWTTPITGGIFESQWDKQLTTSMPLHSIHSYENRIRASKNSVLKLKKVSKEEKERYWRPADKDITAPVISYDEISISGDTDLLLRRVNAHLGATYRVHNIIILCKSGKGPGIVDDIISAWEGPNKNELVTFLGMDGNKIAWVRVESWMDNTTIHGMIQDRLLGKELNKELLANTLLDLVPKYWKKKDFRDFNYIRIECNSTAIWIYVILQSFLLISAFVIVNHDFKGTKVFPRYRGQWSSRYWR